LLKDKITEKQVFGIILAHDLKLIEHQMSDEQKAFLNKAVKNLSARQREVILLYYYESFSFEQISHLMEMGSVQAVRNLLGRAIHKLFEALSKHKNIFIGSLSLLMLLLTHH
jgi:RNA polymerase sigma-70 factor (ECF subfamily)